MKKLICALFIVAFMSAIAGAQDKTASEKWQAKATAGEAAYVCDKCHMMSETAGKCAMCGAEMKPMHVIKVVGDVATVCSCPDKCTCTGMKADDPTKCSCGKDVMNFSTKDNKAIMKAGEKMKAAGEKVKEAGEEATKAVKDTMK